MSIKISSKTITIGSDVIIESAGNKGRSHKKRRNVRHNKNSADSFDKQGVVEHHDMTDNTSDEKNSKKRNKTLVKVKEVTPNITIPACDTEDVDVKDVNIKESITSKNELPIRGLNKDNMFVEHLTAITSMGDVIDSMLKKINKGKFTNKNHKKIVAIITRIKSDCSKLETLF